MDCIHEPKKGIRLNDGGSSTCRKCGLTFHYCTGENISVIRTGSPGPSMCKFCKGKDRKIIK